MKMFNRLLYALPHMRAYLAATAGLAILAGLLIVAQAYGVTQVINRVFLEHQSLEAVLTPLLMVAVVMVVRALLPWLSEILASQASARARMHIRSQLFARLLALGPAYTAGERSGELAHTLTEGVDALDTYFSQLLPQLTTMLLVPLTVLIAVFLTDTLSGVVLLVTAPLLPIFLLLIGKRASSITKRQWQEMGKMSAHFLDVMQGLTTLKLFGRGQTQAEIIRVISERFRVLTMNVLRMAFLSAFVLELAATISTALIAVEIGLRLLYGQMPFTQAFLVLLLTPEFYLPLRTMGARFHASMSGAAAAERIFPILDQPVPHREVLPTIPVQQSITFSHISYAYKHTREEEGARPALSDVSFQLRRGQQIAIVGPSGAGKSTLASLLLRFIEPDQGEILADGKPVRLMSPQQWRQQVAWIPQRPYLFHASIADNIRSGKAEATMEEVMEAAHHACLSEFIKTLPQGYETIVGERGARLSGGQAQRLAIARAFLKNAPVLILDEATANLDSQHEDAILDTLKTLAKDRFVLIIAHRLHTVMRADSIVVLDAGRVVAQGTHEELLNHSKYYRRLIAAYYREEEVQV